MISIIHYHCLYNDLQMARQLNLWKCYLKGGGLHIKKENQVTVISTQDVNSNKIMTNFSMGK